MKRVALAVLLLALLGVVACGRSHEPDAPPSPTLSMEEVFADMDTADVLILGVVRTSDGAPAPGATVFADAYFMPMGEQDLDAGFLQRPVQDESGAWKWADLPKKPRLQPSSTTSDKQGRFVFGVNEDLRKALREHRVKLWAELGDLVATKVQLRADECPARAPALTLGQALRPSVQLVDERGQPVEGAFVALDLHVEHRHGNSIDELLYHLGARSDAEGVAVFPAIPSWPEWGAWLRVNAHERPGYLDTDFTLAMLRSPTPVRVELPAGCTVRGRVELPNGSNGKGVTVRPSAKPIDPNGIARAVLTNDDGTFVLRGVPTESELTFRQLQPPGSDPMSQLFGDGGDGARLTRTVTSKEGGTVDLGVVRLPAALTISGMVLDAAGTPATNGHVMLDGMGSSRPIGPDGRFVIRGVEPGRHEVRATIYEGEFPIDDCWRHELEGAVKDVEAGSTDVVINVTGSGNLIVRFHPKGKPDEPLAVWRSSICWQHYGTGSGGKCSGIRGTFEPGRRDDLRIEAEGYKPKRLGPVEILPGRPTVVDVELEPDDTGTPGK